MNKKIAKIFCVVLSVILLMTTLATTVFAKEYYYGSGETTITVETGKRPWYSLLRPTFTIKNEANYSITVEILDSKGKLVYHCTTLKAGKTYSPLGLKYNETYTVLLSRHWTGGSKPVYSITEGRYIEYIGK